MIKFYCINSYWKKNRRTHAEQEFAKHDLAVDFVSAIDAGALQVRAVVESLSKGMVGCYLSHLKLIEEISRQPTGYYVVFEDDVTLDNDFTSRLNEVVQALPVGIDIAFLGYQGESGIEIDKHWRFIADTHVHGFYGYILTPLGAKKIVKSIDTIRAEIDIQVLQLVRSGAINGCFIANKIVHHNYLFGSTARNEAAANIDLGSDFSNQHNSIKNGKTIAFYHNYYLRIGGIETAIYNLSKELSKRGYKTIVAYSDAEYSMKKYSENSEVINIKNKTIECDVLLLSAHLDYPENIKAKEYVQWIHSDYSQYIKWGLKIEHKPNTKYVAVSKHAATKAKELFNVECDVINNLVPTDYYNRKLRLITNSRISREKGFERIFIFCQKLKARNIPFEWAIYGDERFDKNYLFETKAKFANIKEVTFYGASNDIREPLSRADYLVQLSDFEGYSISVLEALSFGIPVIITNYPVAKEMVDDGVNGYIVNMDLSNLDIDKVINQKPQFKRFDTTKNVVDKWLSII